MDVNINKEYLVKSKDGNFVDLSKLNLKCDDAEYRIARTHRYISVSISDEDKEKFALHFSNYIIPHNLIYR